MAPNKGGGIVREATQFLHSETLSLRVCMSIASVIDPQLHLYQPHTCSLQIMHVCWMYQISEEDKCEQLIMCFEVLIERPYPS